MPDFQLLKRLYGVEYFFFFFIPLKRPSVRVGRTCIISGTHFHYLPNQGHTADR
jgi:hypothetical protein